MAVTDLRMMKERALARDPRSFKNPAAYERMMKSKYKSSVPEIPEKSNTSSSSKVVANSKIADNETQLGELLAKAAEEGDTDYFMGVLMGGTTQLSWEPEAFVMRKVVSEKNNTYLHVAARFERLELIDSLLTDYSSADWFESQNEEGDTAFHIAAKVGHVAVMDLLIRHCKLLKAEGTLEVKNEEGNTALHEALLNKHHHLVGLLLRTNASCSCYLNKERKSPFYLSIEAGNENTYNAMLKAVRQTYRDRDDVFEQSLMEGRSPLQAVILRKDKVMLQEILAKGMHMHMLVHVKDDNGKDPIEVATRIGFEEGKVILDEELRCTCGSFFGVVSDVSRGTLRGTLRAAPDLFLIDSYRFDDHKMRVLLKNVMLNPKQRDISHRHCMEVGLYKSAKTGDIHEFASVLEEYSEEKGLDIQAILSRQRTPFQNTFLHVAMYNEMTDVWKLIFNNSPNLFSMVNSHGDTAFHLAARNGHLEFIEMIVKVKNDRLDKDFKANNNSDTKAATYFINSMRTVVENNDGRTPLQLSYKHHQEAVMEFLIRNNVEEAYYVNKNGTSLLYTAILNSDIGLLKTIYDTVSPHIGQNLLNVLGKQLIKGKSLLFGAIWSQNIEILQELATRIPVLLKVKYEHAEKLMHFAEFLGFHQGANYLRSKIRLVPGTPVQTYSLDEYTLSVIDMVDPEIVNIRKSTDLNRTHERMVKLLSTNSPQDTPKKKLMDVKLYEAAKKGDVDSFIAALEKVSQENNSLSLHIILERRTHSENTCLHVAAIHGNKHLTGFIVFYFRNLLFMTNSEGNTAKHEAARAGHPEVVEILVRFSNYDEHLYSAKEYDTTESSPRSKEWVKNSIGNTSLHEAFLSNQKEVVKYLIESRDEEAYYLNKEGKSGLYLAVEANMVDVVKTILNNMTLDVKKKFISESKNGKFLINAAINRKSTVMLQEIARNIPSQIDVIDKFGQTPLSYAVLTGFLNGVNCLLDEFNMDSSLMDSTGSYLVHIASKMGHVHILEKLLNSFPDSGRFVNRKGQNILHVAAKNGKDRVVSFILKTKDSGFLINKTDEDGNTPLHLAAIKGDPKVVSCLTGDHRVNLNLVNIRGFTALDAAEERTKQTTYQQRLTWSALMSAGAKRSWNADTTVTGKSEQYENDYSKDRVNTLMLVATLIATVTFAAGFTMPGGYNDSPPNEGHATLLHKHMLQTFVFCDAIAMYSAIMVSVTLIWAQLGDITLVMNALKFALPLLVLSLTTMSIAFMAGVYLVVANLTWLAYIVLIFGIICITSVLTLFIPLLFSYSSTSKVWRYITYYPCQLLVLASASRSSDDRHIKED